MPFTDLDAMGIPVSSTGPIPENLIGLPSLFGTQLCGRVEEPWTPLDSSPKDNTKRLHIILAIIFVNDSVGHIKYVIRHN